MGHLLSLPMLLAGLGLLVIAYRRREPSGNLVASAGGAAPAATATPTRARLR
jgi:prolipoprotein diacylglyceryltransferase